MKNLHNYKLIEGKFSADKAREVLFDLINSKINFHSAEILSIRERFSGNVSASEKRIEELKDAQKKLKILLAEVSSQNKKLIITSNIEITVVE